MLCVVYGVMMILLVRLYIQIYTCYFNGDNVVGGIHGQKRGQCVYVVVA